MFNIINTKTTDIPEDIRSLINKYGTIAILEEDQNGNYVIDDTNTNYNLNLYTKESIG